jgi:hypothetical protein
MRHYGPPPMAGPRRVRCPASRGAAARRAGAWHKLPDGRAVPLSLVNNTAPTLATPPGVDARAFPFDMPPGFELRAADLLALAMRLVYEREEVLRVGSESAPGRVGGTV